MDAWNKVFHSLFIHSEEHLILFMCPPNADAVWRRALENDG